MKALLAELISRPVAVLVANSVAARAAKGATSRIPIVFTAGSDPVRDGLVASLNRPGGNVTGASFLAGGLGAKRCKIISGRRKLELHPAVERCPSRDDG